MIFKLGKFAIMGKRDIKSAFCLLPVHREDFHLLGIFFENSFYVDKRLPTGCKISCKLFEQFPTFIHWLVSYKSGNDNLDHYLDDFIFAGLSDANDCQLLLDTFTCVYDDLGVPIAEEKSAGPSEVLVS